MEFRIRLAGTEDLDPLGRLWEAMVEETRRLEPGLEIMPDSGAYFRQFAGVGMTVGSCGVFLAESGGRLLGFTAGQIVRAEAPFRPESYGYVTALFVPAEHRGMGIGRALMRSMTQWFAGRGVERMELHVYARNQGAIGFWEAIGFRTLGYRMGAPVRSFLKAAETEDGNDQT